MPVTLDDAHVYHDDAGAVWPGVTSILGQVEPWRSRFVNIPEAVLEYKRQIGTAVHHATALDDMGLLDEDTVAPEIAGYLEAWRRCVAQNRLAFYHREQVVWHPLRRYAGTLDWMGESAWGHMLLDIKTGPATAGLQAGPQTWAYLKAAKANRIRGYTGYYRRASVHLSPDGRYQVVAHDNDEQDGQDFLDALNQFTAAKRGR